MFTVRVEREGSMIQVPVEERPAALVDRLERGARLLFDMERRGDTGDEYHRWLHLWISLLERYEREQAAA